MDIVSCEDLIKLNKHAIRSKYKFHLDRYRLNFVKRVKDKINWKVNKVLQLHIKDNKEVDPYYRIFFEPSYDQYDNNVDKVLSELDLDQLSALVGLRAFSIAVSEAAFVEIFGTFFEKDFEDE